MLKWIQAFHSVNPRKVCQDATSYCASHLAANKTLPDIIWDDTEVTPGAATVDTLYDKLMSALSNATVCLCFMEKKKREDCKIYTQAKLIKLYFQGSILTFSIFFVLSDTESDTIS